MTMTGATGPTPSSDRVPPAGPPPPTPPAPQPALNAYLRVLGVVVVALGAASALTDFASKWQEWVALGLLALALGWLLTRAFFPPPVDKKEVTITLATILVVVLTSGYMAVSTFGSAASPALKLDQPSDGDQIARLVTMGGTVANLASGETIWVFSSKMTDSNLYLHPGPCVIDDTSGRWRCNEWSVGEEADPPGTSYRLVAVRASSEWTADFVQIWKEIDQARTDEEKKDKYSRLAFFGLPQGVVSAEPVIVS